MKGQTQIGNSPQSQIFERQNSEFLKFPGWESIKYKILKVNNPGLGSAVFPKRFDCGLITAILPDLRFAFHLSPI